MSEHSDSNDDGPSFTSIIEDVTARMMQNIPEQAAPPSSPVQSSSSLAGSPNILASSTFSGSGPAGSLLPPGNNDSSLLNLEVPSLLLAPRTLTPSLRRYDPELANLHELHTSDHTESTIGNDPTSQPDIGPHLHDEPTTRDRAATTDQNPWIPPTSPIFNSLPLPLFPTSNEQGSPGLRTDPPSERPRPNASTVERLLEMMRTLSIQDPEEDDGEESPPDAVERRWGIQRALLEPDNIWLGPPSPPRAFHPTRRLQERAQTIIDKLETLDRDLVQKFCAMGCAGGEEGDRCTICWESFIEDLEANPKAGDEEKEKANEEKVALLPCAHIFHSSCLKQWFVTPSTTCPICRFELDPLRLLTGGFGSNFAFRGGGRLVRREQVSPTGDTFPETLWVDDADANRRRVEVDEVEYEVENDWTDEDDWTDEEDDFLTEEEGEGPFIISPEIYRVPIEGEDDDEDPPQLEEVARTDYRFQDLEDEDEDTMSEDDSIPDLEDHVRIDYRGQEIVDGQAPIDAPSVSVEGPVPSTSASTSRDNPERVAIEIIDSSPSTSRSASPVQPAVFDWMEEVDSVNRWGASVPPPRNLPGNALGFRIPIHPGDSSSVAAERSSSPALSAPDSLSDRHSGSAPLSDWDDEFARRLLSDSSLPPSSRTDVNVGPQESTLAVPSTSTQEPNDPIPSTSETGEAVDETGEEGYLQVPQNERPPITRWPSPLMHIESLRPNPANFTSSSSVGRSPPLSPGSIIPPWGVSPRPLARGGFPFGGGAPAAASVSATEGERRLWMSALDVMRPQREWSVPVGVVDQAGGVRAWIAKRQKELSEER
ncbi:hypothetical protein CPB86DRAFT_872604 [Serendipita vermifera]|nr:hypothetical protein CPB86DRAFT_872604 [Serendipita vermifera]